MPKASLTRKIVLPLAAVMLLLQLGLAAYALNHERKALLQQLDTRAARLASIRHAFDLQGDELDEKKLAEWLGTTLLEQQDVLFCEIVAGEDRTLFHEGRPDEQRSRRYAFPIMGQNRPSGGAEATANDDRSQTAATTGTLYLALSTADTEQALIEARRTFAAAILVGTAIALLLATLIVRYAVGNTVARLLRHAKAASLPDLSQSTASQSSPPLDQLAEMLDGMTTQLREVVEEEKNLTAQMISEQSQREQAVP